jgi:hypothetical protein
MMHCPICSALERESMVEGEAEATATLKRRLELSCSHRSDAAHGQELDQDVLRSRKRQAHIASELHEHRSKQHPNLERVKAAAR